MRRMPFHMRLMSIALLAMTGCSPKKVPVEEISGRVDLDDTAAAPIVVSEEDWNSWRGPSGNGIAADQEVPIRWSETENVIWKAKVPGRGHASPTVVGDQVFLASADERAETQFVVALDRSNGQQRWQTQVNQGGFAREVHAKGTQANSTLACDGEHVFAAFLHHDAIHVTAISIDGEIAWQTTVGAFNSKFGYAPSPLIYKTSVIIAADNRGGGYIAALDRSTGEPIWRKRRGAVSTYSSPIVGHVDGKDQLLITGGDAVTSYDPATGEENWSVPGTSEATCGTVVWDANHVYASGGYPDAHTLCIRVDGDATEVWSNRTKLYEPSMLVSDGFLYAVSDQGIGFCWDAETGAQMWKKRLGGNFSSALVLAGDKLFATADDGTCTVFAADNSDYIELARNRLDTDAYATPTICGGRIYFRVGQGDGPQRQEMLYCIGEPVEN
ncbi:outer membrane biogenesis protein BamB [Rosistilla oblonga]|uniref:Outer membrane biogenesis protein BamB n=2 Tax=Rosistilla oblonga TaxID=2527990 RepID=A0A518IW43_9BACT|nr:outer membrane biogenesis protein BamB [Rosistilla oblonga]